MPSPLRKWQIMTVFVLSIAYIGILLNRRIPSSVLPALRNDTTAGYTSQTTAILFAVGNAAHLGGGLFAGSLVDKAGGRIVLIAVTGIVPPLLVGFSFASSDWLRAVMIGLSRLVQSAVTPAVAKVISWWFPPHAYARVVGAVLSASRVGAVLVGIISGAMLDAGLDWRTPVWVVAGFLMLCFLFCVFFLRQGPASVGLSDSLTDEAPMAKSSESDTETVKESQLETFPFESESEKQRDTPTRCCDHDVNLPPPTPQPIRVCILRFIASPRFWVLCLCNMLIWMMFEFDVFIPLFTQDTTGASAGVSALVSAAHPALMIVSMLIGGHFLDKLSYQAGGFLVMGSLVCLTVCFGILLILSVYGLSSVVSATVLSAAVGFFIGLPSYLPQNLFSLRFGGQHECGILASLIDVFGWLASILFDVIADDLTAGGNWINMFIVLTATGVAACALFLVFALLDGRAERRLATIRAAPESLEMPPVAKIAFEVSS